MAGGFPRLSVVASTLFFWETTPPLYNLLFPNISDPSLRLMIFLRNSDGTSVAAQDTSRSPFDGIPTNSALRPDLSQTDGHDGSSCWMWGLYFGSGHGSNSDTSEKYTAFLPLLLPEPPASSPPDFIESSHLENPICYRNSALPFPIFRHSCLSDLVLLC